jgi:exodeoxyribonuclease-3
MLSVATFNVNSVKARLPNLLAWLDHCPTDIVLLQELKCETDAFPALELQERGYHLAVHGQKTYNGVAVLSKYPLRDVTRQLPGMDADDQARYIECLVDTPLGDMRVASAYVPNGQAVDSDKFPYKLGFFERLHAHWQAVLARNEIAVLGGDFNCAPTPLDVYDANALDGTVCYHPEERKRLRAMFYLGLYDAFRLKHPTTKQFSWWDYRMNGYERGHGLRIDHLLLSARAADLLADSRIDEQPRAQERPSDHAPVIAQFAA